ncbi:MAG: zinc-finger domain-containing protein [Lysobacteraceae bacterium]
MSPASPAPSAPAPITVQRSELPLSCPPSGATLWNMHPKVYLPIEATGEAICPYCGAHYLLAR